MFLSGIQNKNDINALNASPLAIRNETASIGANIIRSIILPELQREVNEDQNFAPLRQVYSGMLLATWFKRTLKQSLLGQIYANKNKIKGLEINGGQPGDMALAVSPSRLPSKRGLKGQATQRNPPNDVEYIYQRYLQAYKKGVFNFIKEDVDKYTNETIPRKYFSGGIIEGYDGRNKFLPNGIPIIHELNYTQNAAMNAEIKNNDDDAMVALNEANTAMVEGKKNRAMLTSQEAKASLENYIVARGKAILEIFRRKILSPEMKRDFGIDHLNDILSTEEIQPEDIKIITGLPRDVTEVFQEFFEARVYEVVSELRQRLDQPVVPLSNPKLPASLNLS